MNWKESSQPPDSSSSEGGKDTPPETVHFTVGDSPDEVPSTTTPGFGQLPPVPKTFDRIPEDKMVHSTSASHMVRSSSQDTNMEVSTTEVRPRNSHSENSLKEFLKKPSVRELPTVLSLDEETLSTDSNSTADNEEMKRRRRKLFPAFRKSKNKPS